MTSEEYAKDAQRMLDELRDSVSSFSSKIQHHMRVLAGSAATSDYGPLPEEIEEAFPGAETSE